MDLQSLRNLCTSLQPLRQTLTDLATLADLLQEAETARSKAEAQTKRLLAETRALEDQIAALTAKRDQVARTSQIEIATYKRLLDEARQKSKP